MERSVCHDHHGALSSCCPPLLSTHSLTWKALDRGFCYTPWPKSMLQLEDQLRFGHAMSCEWGIINKLCKSGRSSPQMKDNRYHSGPVLGSVNQKLSLEGSHSCSSLTETLPSVNIVTSRKFKKTEVNKRKHNIKK